MKLLSPQEVREQKTQEIARNILRAKETEEVTRKINQNRAKAEADFSSALAHHRELWAQEEEEHRKRKEEMQSEIDTLEAKKLNALVPINILKVSAEDKMKEATDFLANLRKRENDTEELKERLEDRLDDVAEKETELLDKERKLSLRQQGIERQEENIRLSNNKLTEEMKELLSLKAQAIQNIESRTKEVVLKEQTLNAKEQLIKRNIKSIEEREIQLADERATLDKAWKELERKKISP